jgi:hypothetical protein
MTNFYFCAGTGSTKTTCTMAVTNRRKIDTTAQRPRANSSLLPQYDAERPDIGIERERAIAFNAIR